jgi:hypothetical protein
MATDTLKGYAPKTPAKGYQLAEHRCSTAKCRTERYQFKFEISVGAKQAAAHRRTSPRLHQLRFHL